MHYKIEVRRLGPQPMVAIRRRTSPQQLKETLRSVYAAIAAFLEKRDIEDAGLPFTRFYDSGGGSGEVDVECGLLLPRPVEGEGDIYCGELPGGLAAVAIHQGEYEHLQDAHEAVKRWIERNGRCPEGPPWEVYQNDPSHVKDPAEWRTEVFCVMSR